MKVKEFLSYDYNEVFYEINQWLVSNSEIDIQDIKQTAMPPDGFDSEIKSDHMTYLVVSIWYKSCPT